MTGMLNNENRAAGSWNALLRIAGAGVLLAVMLVLVDMVLSFTGGDVPTGQLSAVDWFACFQENPFLGLRNLGLFNIINPILMLPLVLVILWSHRKTFPAAAALALVLYLLGAAVYIANNRALTMLTLSSQYAAAAGAEKEILAAAGAAMLAQAEDFTPGSFPGLFLSSLSSLITMAVLVWGRVFKRWIALTGLAGTFLLFVFTISVTFYPAVFDIAMALAILGGLLMLVYNISMALAVFRLAAHRPQAGENTPALSHAISGAGQQS